MAILRSADTERLIEELKSADPLRRQTAAARLGVIGARAVTRLLALAGDTSDGAAQVAALGALEAIGDRRSGTLARTLTTGENDQVAIAAIGVLGAIAAEDDRAFDQLTSLALDRSVSDDRRVAAVNALQGLPASVTKPIMDVLATDAAVPVQSHVARAAAGATEPIDVIAERGLPSDAAVFTAIVREEGADARVTLLRDLIDRVRVRERTTKSAGARAAWMASRGLLHQHLAARGSRLAVYDLRETLEAAREPLPVGFLAAAAAVGDVNCLEPLAAAWINEAPGAKETDDRWWRDHLREAFAAIVKRERVTRRHAVLRRILERWPAAGVLVASAPRS
jgi:hypothetical protein